MTRNALCLLLASLSGLGYAQTTLRLNLQQGKTYTYVTETTMAQQSSSTTQRITQAVKVTSKKGDRYKMSVSVVDAKVSAKAGTPMANQAKQIENQLKSMKFTADYGLRGNSQGAPTFSGAGSQAQQMMGGMAAMNMGFMGMEFPQAPVKVGSSWTTTMDLAKMMKASGLPASVVVTGGPLLVKYTLKGLNGKAANIAYTISGKVNMSITNPQNNQKLNMAMSMAGNGISVVDVATGLQRTNTSNTTMNMSGPASMTQKITTKMTLKG